MQKRLVAPLLDGSDKMAVAKQIRWALSNAGFMYVKNHGVAQDFVDQVFDVTRHFFDLPMERKMALHVSRSDVALRGYIEPFGENTDPGKTRDLKECFDIGPERANLEGPFFGPNQWPDGFPEFQELVYGYHRKMVALSKTLLKGIALSLDLPEAHFEGLMRDPISIQRLLHYPPQPANAAPGEKGCGAHTDFGGLTLLLQDENPGLQVWDRHSKSWIHAVPVPGTYVVNLGDMIARWTNDQYRSTLHRVVNMSGRERYSVPFFFSGNPDHVVECLPTCLAPGEAPRYPAVTVEEHHREMYRRTYG